jgi:hypothetical protein
LISNPTLWRAQFGRHLPSSNQLQRRQLAAALNAPQRRFLPSISSLTPVCEATVNRRSRIIGRHGSPAVTFTDCDRQSSNVGAQEVLSGLGFAGPAPPVGLPGLDVAAIPVGNGAAMKLRSYHPSDGTVELWSSTRQPGSMKCGWNRIGQGQSGNRLQAAAVYNPHLTGLSLCTPDLDHEPVAAN